MLNNTPTGGANLELVAAGAVTAGTVIDNSEPIVVPSRLRVEFAKGTGDGVTTPGQILAFGTDVNDAELTEVIDVPIITDATKNLDGKRTFKSVSSFTPLGLVIDGDGTMSFNTIVGGTSYTVGMPKYYDLECVVEDSVTGDFIMALFHHAWISKGLFASGDANKLLDEDIAFTIQDPDADMAVSDTTDIS
jgi:hypothetical protein